VVVGRPEGKVLADTTPEAPYATVEVDLPFARASKMTYPRCMPE
jgi:N-carbamoylputrescine amidase